MRDRVLPAAVRCDMVLHRAFRARHVRKNEPGISGEVRHGVTSGVSCQTSLNTKHLTSTGSTWHGWWWSVFERARAGHVGMVAQRDEETLGKLLYSFLWNHGSDDSQDVAVLHMFQTMLESWFE